MLPVKICNARSIDMRNDDIRLGIFIFPEIPGFSDSKFSFLGSDFNPFYKGIEFAFIDKQFEETRSDSVKEKSVKFLKLAEGENPYV